MPNNEAGSFNLSAPRCRSTAKKRASYVPAGIVDTSKALVKDQNFFRDKTWNNSYIFTDKIFKFFHEKNLKNNKQLEENLTIWQKKTRELKELAREEAIVHNKTRVMSQYSRIVSKRYVLMEQSKQPIIEGRAKTAFKFSNGTRDNDFSSCFPQALVQKVDTRPQSNTCMLNLINRRPNNSWNRVVQMNPKQLQNTITDTVIRMDEEGFKSILNKAEKENERQERLVAHKKLLYNRIRGKPADEQMEYSLPPSPRSVLKKGNETQISKIQPLQGEKKFDHPDFVGLYVNDVNRVNGVPNNRFIKLIVEKSSVAREMKEGVQQEHNRYRPQTHQIVSLTKADKPQLDESNDENNMSQLEAFDSQIKVRRKFVENARYPKVNLQNIKKIAF